jgi:imidazolonepropionase-like amidohydrolase
MSPLDVWPGVRSARTFGAMKSSLVAACIAVLAAPIDLGAQGTQPKAIKITDVTVIDGTDAAPRPHMTVILRGGRITDLLPAGASAPATDTTVDGAGRYLIPGLIDSHVHIGTTPWAREVDHLDRALRGGITSVLDMAGDTRATGNLARAALVGEIRAPSIYYVALMAGPPFFTDRRVLAASRGFAPGTAPWMQSVTNETDLVRAVATAKGTGATAIKLYAALTGSLAGRIVAEAKRQGIRTIAHATTFPGRPLELVQGGVNMLAHAPYLVWEGSAPSDSFALRGRGDFIGVPATSPSIENLLIAMRDAGTMLNPTVWIFDASQDSVAKVRAPWMYAVTKRAAQLGVPIVAGTDGLFGIASDSLPTLHRELELLVSGAGLTPAKALAAGTLNGARAIGIADQAGTIAVGKAADLVLLDADPLVDIRNTRRIAAVIKNGVVVRP